jgi:hypothetical protein
MCCAEVGTERPALLVQHVTVLLFWRGSGMCVLSIVLLLIIRLDNVMIIFMSYLPEAHKINAQWGSGLWFVACDAVRPSSEYTRW